MTRKPKGKVRPPRKASAVLAKAYIRLQELEQETHRLEALHSAIFYIAKAGQTPRGSPYRMLGFIKELITYCTWVDE